MTTEELAAYQITHYSDHGLYDAIKGYVSIADKAAVLLPKLAQLNDNAGPWQLYEDAPRIAQWIQREAIAARWHK